MKFKHIFIGLSLGCAFVLPSCDDILDVEPEFQRDVSDTFQTLEDYEFALTGAYARFRQSGYYSTGGNGTGSYSQLPDMLTDNVAETNESLANFISLTDWVYTADNSLVEETWQDAYSVINQANIVLRDIDRFAEEDPTGVNRIKGQALAIRGFVHFDILRYWGVEFERNSSELGIPYKTTPDFEERPARLTVKESYDRIYADLEEAEALLADVDRPINSATNRSRIDDVAVKGMLARINLYAEQYQAAEAYATQVIDLVPLATRAEFPGIWSDANQAEVLWAVAFNAGEGSPSQNTYFASGNRNTYRPSLDLLQEYNQTADIRYSAYFATRNSRGGTPRVVLSKFIGRGTALDNVVNFKVLRVAEMYLIRAEARAMQGNTAGALADLNALRAARIQGYTPVALTGQALLDAIALERQKELIGEGHRWFDLKRTTRTIVREDCTVASFCELEPTAREWVWPIPQSELIANPNMQGQQSPGY
ncbi:RagB/SusD family nutrient uptake outer membrane protein [Pontibacter roseus]|uniref:RagB/SusD family nutrient uptake outer membrane protein n=1 Tax=Pontibacter roseus TaxID=336989 RepID=UPI0003A25CA6|nr:RagB/SusD family nutrient uptake outer membrane protein [Pontibacter roseus]